jgi:hypothetical protein
MQNPMILWEKSDIAFKYISIEQLFPSLHETGHQGSTPLISYTTIFLERTLNIFLIFQLTADPRYPLEEHCPWPPPNEGAGIPRELDARLPRKRALWVI